jgi:HPt (histidine-containing phosphotransfer) domain-containing protein
MASSHRPPFIKSPAVDKAAVTRLSREDCRILIESVTRDLESIEAAWRCHDEAGLLERIHSLKGALFVVGEHSAANDCGLTELCIRMRGSADCSQAVERLKASLCRLLEAYSRHVYRGRARRSHP